MGARKKKEKKKRKRKQTPCGVTEYMISLKITLTDKVQQTRELIHAGHTNTTIEA